MIKETYIDSDGSKLTVALDFFCTGCVEYRNVEGQRHRLDGPAYEDKVGEYREWCKNGRCHRLDGPAREWGEGSKEWWVEDTRHRLDGPACEYDDGVKYWYVEDKEVEPLFLVAYWLERGRCCWYDEEAQELRFGDD